MRCRSHLLRLKLLHAPANSSLKGPIRSRDQGLNQGRNKDQKATEQTARTVPKINAVKTQTLVPFEKSLDFVLRVAMLRGE
jgi:hypothetical protein